MHSDKSISEADSIRRMDIRKGSRPHASRRGKSVPSTASSFFYLNSRLMQVPSHQLIDFAASGSQPTSLGQAKKVLDILQTYYCERLGRAICINGSLRLFS